MLEKIVRAIITAVVLYMIAGCGAAEEAANEGEQALQNGMKTKERAEAALEEKNERIDFDF